MSLSFETFPAFALRLRPGRRRMLDGLLAAGPAGLSMISLAGLYYGDDPMPPSGIGSVGTQIQRLRSQVSREGWSLVGTGSKRMGPGGASKGVFVLSFGRPGEIEPPAVSGSVAGRPLHETFGILAKPGFRDVLVPRLAFMERAAG